MEASDILIICEGKSDVRLLRMILDASDRVQHTEFFAAGQAPTPQVLLSAHGAPKGVRGGMLGWLRSKAEKYRGAIVVYDLEFGGPTQPAPFGGRLGGLWLAPAVPSIESWLLADLRSSGLCQLICRNKYESHSRVTSPTEIFTFSTVSS